MTGNLGEATAFSFHQECFKGPKAPEQKMKLLENKDRE